MDLNFDLLGFAITDPPETRGRPEHVPSPENMSLVRLLLGLGWTRARVAAALRITQPTLRKHYFSVLSQDKEARHQLKAAQLMMLYRAADDGNVAAIKELGEEIRRFELAHTQAEIEEGQEKAPKRGKKEEAQLAAESAGSGTGWGDDLLPEGPTKH